MDVYFTFIQDIIKYKKILDKVKNKPIIFKCLYKIKLNRYSDVLKNLLQMNFSSVESNTLLYFKLFIIYNKTSTNKEFEFYRQSDKYHCIYKYVDYIYLRNIDDRIIIRLYSIKGSYLDLIVDIDYDCKSKDRSVYFGLSKSSFPDYSEIYNDLYNFILEKNMHLITCILEGEG